MTTKHKVNILERTQKVIAERLCIEQSRVHPNASIQQDLGADSLEFMDLIIGIEEEFGITITDEEASKIVTVQGLADFIQAK